MLMSVICGRLRAIRVFPLLFSKAWMTETLCVVSPKGCFSEAKDRRQAVNLGIRDDANVLLHLFERLQNGPDGNIDSPGLASIRRFLSLADST